MTNGQCWVPQLRTPSAILHDIYHLEFSMMVIMHNVKANFMSTVVAAELNEPTSPWRVSTILSAPN